MTKLLNPGDVLDDAYEIVEFISQGGFGAVYRARQLSMDRDVAVKLLIPGAQPDFEGLVQRFHNEVKAVRNLRHPNTVQIYDFHETSDDQLYFTMEYLEGRSLRDLIKRGEAISPRRTANILSQILKSLAEAHSMGIVHRDIKPANIMLVDMYGEEDFVKVLDFGIAKAMQDGGQPEGDEPLTRTGFLVGTVRYMAPERIAGDPAGPYSDIYSLGLVGASLLIGQPILGNSSRLEVMQMQMGTKPMPIPESIKASAFGPILERSLAKNPRDRYQSAENMLADLSSVPASTLSESPIHVSGEIPIWETLSDQTAPGMEPTTVDSSLQPAPASTAELAADDRSSRPASLARRNTRPNTRETASSPRDTAGPTSASSKGPMLIGVGAMLLVIAAGLAWYLTGEQSGGEDNSPQSADPAVVSREPGAPVEQVARPDDSKPDDSESVVDAGAVDSPDDGGLADDVEPAPVQAEQPDPQPNRAERDTPSPNSSAQRRPTPSPKRPSTTRREPSKAPDEPTSGDSKPEAERDDRDIIPVFGSEAPAEAKPDENDEEDIPVF